MLTVQRLVVWRRQIRSHHQMEWARVRCLGPELVACSDDAGNACNEMIIGNVYKLIYIRWSHVLGHLVGHVMGWSSHYSMCPPRTRQRPRCLKNDKPKSRNQNKKVVKGYLIMF